MTADITQTSPDTSLERYMAARSGDHNPYSHYLAAAFAFLFDDNDRVLLLREQRKDRKYMWDLPGGTLTDQEKPVTGLMREIYEETRLVAHLVSPLCWLKWDVHDSGQPILVAFYVARAEGAEVRLSEEHDQFEWVTMRDFTARGLQVSAEREIVQACFSHYKERDKS